MGGQHLGVVHDLALVRGDLQRGQNIIHPRNVGGGASGGAVEAPLEDVEAGPAGHVGALMKRTTAPASAALKQRRASAETNCSASDLYALPLAAGERTFHHAVVLPQHPALVYHLDVHSSQGREGVGSQGVLLGHLWSSPGVVDGENNISFRYVKVPSDDGGGLGDLDYHLQEDIWRLETQNWEQRAIHHVLLTVGLRYRCPPPGGSITHGIKPQPSGGLAGTGYLKRSSFKNAGTFIDGVSQQVVFLALHLLCRSVQRFRDQTSFRHLTLGENPTVITV